MFKYTAEILPYHDYDLETSVKELASLGFKEVNLWSSASPLAHHVNPGDDPKQVLSILSKYGLKPCGLTMYGKTQTEMLERIDFAADLGIDTVIFDCEANFSDFISKFLPPLVELGEKRGVRIAVENHLTVPFSADFESGGNEEKRWDDGVDTPAQIKRLVTEIDHPNLGVCLAPPHLWVMGETISHAITFLAERKRLYYYYIWDIDREYRRGIDGLNFGPGEKQLPRPDGTLNHAVSLAALKQVGFTGAASLKCHGTHGWSLEKITSQLRASDEYVRGCLNQIGA
jgi:sugar phosphate isomerase/epimerase